MHLAKSEAGTLLDAGFTFFKSDYATLVGRRRPQPFVKRFQVTTTLVPTPILS